MSTKRAIYLLVLVLLLVAASLPLGSVSAQGGGDGPEPDEPDGGSDIIQSTPGDDCATAPNPMIYDDGASNNSSRLGAGMATYVQLFTPPAYPYRLTKVCAVYRQRNPPDYALLPYNVVVFADTGSGPGSTVLYSFADTALNLVNGTDIWYGSDVAGYTITSGSVYIGVQWDASTYGENQVRLDTTAATPLNPGYRSADGGTTWADMVTVNAAYRALFIRAGGYIGAINVNPTGPTTLTEGGPAQAYTYTLTSAPTAAVTIPASVSSGECTLTGGPNIVLTAANWNTGAIVTVTPVDDAVVDGNLPCNLITGDPTSTDLNYDTLGAGDSPDVTITINDNDTAGINVNPAGPLSLNEPGPPQIFTFTLTSAPTAAVTIPVSVSSGECTLTGGPNVVLDGTSWNLGVPVTVTPIDDTVTDGDLPCNLVTGDPTSGDAAYNALTAAQSPDVNITILDDDVASIIVAPTGPLSLPEAGGTQTFTFTLGTQPAGGASVAFPVSVSSGECTLVGGPTVTIPNASWNTGVTVTVNAVNDALVDGDLPCNLVTGDPTSTNAAYDALTAAQSPDVNITILDDDVLASIIVAPTGPLNLNEAGGTQTFTFTLGSQPAGGASVAFPISVSSGECTLVGGPTVTIPNASWNTGVTVTVNAVNDAIADGNLPCNLVTGDPTSADGNYDALTAAQSPDVNITIIDDDVASIIVAPTGPLTLNEAGGTQTFTFTLGTQPAGGASVAFPVSVSSGECTLVGGPTVTIPNASWNTGVTVTVNAVNDAIADGNLPCNLVTGDPTSGDAAYDALTAAQSPDVNITIIDDEVASIAVAPTGPLSLSEAGGTQTFTFTLGTQPGGGADVAFPVSVSSGECTLVGGPTVTIPNGSWNTGVTVTVNAVDDALVDGDLPCNLVTGDPTSGDAAYDALTAAQSPDVTITILDDDVPVTPAILVAPTAMTISEPATTNTFNIATTTAPTADIDIPLTVSDTTECLVNGLAATTVTIPMATWAAGVTVTVNAVDDTLVDGAQPCTITTGAAVTTDGTYSGMDPANVVVIVMDDETRPPSEAPQPTGPTAEDHARAQAPLCADLDGSTNSIVRATVPGGTVTNGGVYCRILADGGVFVNEAGSGEIGNIDVIQMGIIHAVDVFGMAGGYSYPAWNSSITACLQGSGRIMYLDALTAPRALWSLPTYTSGGYTCAVLYHAGTIVLVP